MWSSLYILFVIYESEKTEESKSKGICIDGMMTKLAISGYLAPSIFLIACRPSQAEWSRHQRLHYLYLVSVMVCDVYHGLTSDKSKLNLENHFSVLFSPNLFGSHSYELFHGNPILSDKSEL